MAAFALIVDNFGIKCRINKDTLHLLCTLKDACTIKIDWSGSKCMDMTLKWDCPEQKIVVFMLGFDKA